MSATNPPDFLRQAMSDMIVRLTSQIVELHAVVLALQAERADPSRAEHTPPGQMAPGQMAP